MIVPTPSERSGASALAAVLLLVVALVPCVATAQPDADPRVERARVAFTRAEEHFRTHDFALALDGFERAHALLAEVGHPRSHLVLYNVALCNERLGRHELALAQFEQFLVGAPADAPYRDEATVRAAELRQRLALARGDAAPSHGGVSPVGPVIAAVGGAAIVAGAVLGGLALAESDSARAGCVDTSCPPDARAGIDGARMLAYGADGLIFGGLAVAAAGIVLSFVLVEGDDDVRASAICGPTGCTATLEGSF